MPTRTLAVVPLRAPGVGKTRLASVLDPAQRARLAGAMLGDVARALHGSAVDDVVVAAGGPPAAAAAAALGLEVVLDPGDGRGLDEVLAAAVGHRSRTHDVLIVTADLPCLTTAEIDTLLAADAEVVIAPTTGGGTGGLLRRPGSRIATAYGPGSATRHRELARAAGASTVTRHLDGFTYDVDTFTDLIALHEVELGAATAAVLPALLGTRAAS
jgi:2-phospho-L-lactate/phosphoenolpyruvate guanylyltransferase